MQRVVQPLPTELSLFDDARTVLGMVTGYGVVVRGMVRDIFLSALE